MGDSLLVIGGSSFDITCSIAGETVPHDSNPGRIYGSTGGVGKNIAENCALMGLDTSFITATGDDSFADAIRQSLKSRGIDAERSVRAEGTSSCVYVSILDKNGGLELGSSDFSVLDRVTPGVIADNAEYIGSFGLVYADANLREETLREIAKHVKGALFAESVSVTKAPRLLAACPAIHTLKTNRAELESISGMKASTLKEIEKACRALASRGIKRVCVTLGEEGSLLFENGGSTYLPAFPPAIKSVNGAGDAFAAAAAYAYLKGFSAEETLCLGTAAAHIALASEFTVSPQMSEENLLNKYKQLRSIKY